MSSADVEAIPESESFGVPDLDDVNVGFAPEVLDPGLAKISDAASGSRFDEVPRVEHSN